MARILFIDDRMGEVLRQWHLSGCETEHVLLPVELFESIERTAEIVRTYHPDVIVVGFGLGVQSVNGASVIRALKTQGFDGAVIANSGGGKQQFLDVGVEVDGSADRNPRWLYQALKSVGGIDERSGG
jgi:hypothetical protein